ncbi:MAG: AAA family ATPase [Saprospiraceae bacterium]|nr:AAA family ATPase [Saprospiraceae bacterium]
MYQLLNESVRSKLFIQKEHNDPHSYLVKTCNSARQSKSELVNEFEICKKLDLSNVRKAIKETVYLNKDAFVYEFVEGCSLSEFIKTKTLDFESFYAIAKNLIETLISIHEKGIIHLRLNNHNVLIHPNDLNTCIIDFSLASYTKEVKSIHFAEWGSELAYIAPEQTGHLNKKVDERTDLYSIGIILYEMWSGRLPFTSENAPDMVHDHLVKNATPLVQIRSETPKVLQLIIEKLLLKNPDRRYQSAKGLMHDLNQSYEFHQSSQSGIDFTPGELDVPTYLSISTGFYGRKKEWQELTNIFTKIRSGQQEDAVTFLTGPNGIGKSRLANEFSKFVIQESGLFLSSKLSQHRIPIPNQIVVDILKNLASYILSQSDESMSEWKSIIQDSVQDIGQLLIELVPEYSWIIGDQDPLPALSITQSESRLNFLFHNIISTIAAEDHPVVLFIDDMQWTDNASWKNLEILLNGKGIPHLMLLGAFWNGELKNETQFKENITRLLKDQVDPRLIELKNLIPEEIKDFLSDSFELEDLPSLVEMSYRKTHGNPFYLQNYLDSLFHKKYLSFNSKTQKWSVQTESIKDAEWAENVIAYLNEQVKKLPIECMRILGIASCLGYHFKKRDLIEFSEVDPFEINRILKILVENNLLNDYSIDEYHFEHESIFQNALELLEPKKKELIHYKIASKWKNNLGENTSDTMLFQLTNQYNQCKSLLQSAEKINVAKLNFQSGQIAKKATDFDLAFNFFLHSTSLISKSDWRTNYEFCLSVHHAAAESGMKIGKYKQAHQFLDESLNNSKDPMDRILAHEIKLLHFCETHQFPSAIEYLLDVLKEIGYRVRRNPSKLEILKEFIYVKWFFIGKQVDELIHLPEMKEEKPLAFIKLTGMAQVAIFGSAPDILPIINFKQVSLSLKYGNSPYLPYALAAHGFAITVFMGDLAKGHDLAKTALQMTERPDALLIKARVMVIYYGFLSYWKNPIVASKAPLKEAYLLGRQTGDLLYASFALAFHNEIRFYIGDHLSQLLTDQSNDCLLIKNLKQNLVYIIAEYQRQLVINLTQPFDEPWVFNSEGFDEKHAIQELANLGDKASTFGLFHNKLVIACIFNRYDIAEEFLEFASTYEDESTSRQINYSSYLFYSGIVEMMNLSNKEASLRTKAIKNIRKKLKILHSHSSDAPQNYKNKLRLLEALMAKFEGRNKDAFSFFLEAIQLSKNSGFIGEEAICRELFGNHLIASGEIEYGEMMINAAYQCYNNWGARNKCLQMLDEYKAILGNPADSGFENSIASFQNIFDLNTIIKSNQILSSENNLDRLLFKMVELVMTNASCSKVVVLYKDKHGQFIPYVKAVQEEINILDPNIHQLTLQVPQSVIMYVSHSKNEFVSPNLSNEKPYYQDPYVNATQPISVLCLPIIFNKNILGAIYLENNLTENAFDKKRVEFFKTIVSQLAISMENVALYEGMEDKVIERTSQLQQKNEELTIEKNKSEELLLNILPEEIAIELKEKGSFKAKKYDKVTILFLDIKDFTEISEWMEPEELVLELDTCFKKFDEIIVEYGLEKIKTVGDAYLAVGGLPDNNKATATDVVNAAMKMVEFTKNRAEERNKNGQKGFEIRVGINTGSVVAGIVGIKKFQFDIWGNAVNVAARMEQNSQAGRVNLSSTTYELVNTSFICESRGKLPAKGLGDIEMYYLIGKSH